MEFWKKIDLKYLYFFEKKYNFLEFFDKISDPYNKKH